jgi:hypothetical protein
MPLEFRGTNTPGPALSVINTGSRKVQQTEDRDPLILSHSCHSSLPGCYHPVSDQDTARQFCHDSWQYDRDSNQLPSER